MKMGSCWDGRTKVVGDLVRQDVDLQLRQAVDVGIVDRVRYGACLRGLRAQHMREVFLERFGGRFELCVADFVHDGCIFSFLCWVELGLCSHCRLHEQLQEFSSSVYGSPA